MPEKLAAAQGSRDAEGLARTAPDGGYGGSTAPSTDLGGALLLVVGGLVLLSVAFAVLFFAGLWMALDVPLRFILETLPLSIAAERMMGPRPGEGLTLDPAAEEKLAAISATASVEPWAVDKVRKLLEPGELPQHMFGRGQVTPRGC